jgi:hypothetical protein
MGGAVVPTPVVIVQLGMELTVKPVIVLFHTRIEYQFI